MKWYLCGSRLHFLNDQDGGHVFMALSAICISSFEKCLFNPFPFLKNWIFYFLFS